MIKNRELRFSIRKLTIGAVSVMFGAVVFGMSTNQVHAAETTDVTTEQQSGDQDTSDIADPTSESQVTSQKTQSSTQASTQTQQ